MKDKIMLGHGSGGAMGRRLIRELILKYFSDRRLSPLEDAALLEVKGTHLAFTTDSYVVRPPFFPGGDIGKLAVCGTLNDLSVMGARPLFLSCGLILEEGLEAGVLSRVLSSMQEAASVAGVPVVTGDTKVVEKGKADGLFINTAGVGLVEEGRRVSGRPIKEGDAVLLSGTIGDHGIAVFSAREELHLKTPVLSDCAALHRLIGEVLDECAGEVRFMRDPTRGGLAAVLNEVAGDRKIGLLLKESEILVREEVRAVCELMGFDPLHLANEGKVLIIAAREAEEKILRILRGNELGREARLIGRVTAQYPGKVVLETAIGGRRIVDVPESDPLPRIC